MIEIPADHDARIAIAASGLVAQFNEAGIIAAAHIQVARTLMRLTDEDDEKVMLAAAMAVRALTEGSACLDLTTAKDSLGLPATLESDDDARALVAALDYPEVDEWLTVLWRSPAVADETTPSNQRPFRLVGTKLYLERYWLDEEAVRAILTDRSYQVAPTVDEERLTAALERWVPDRLTPTGTENPQRRALESAVRGWTSVVAGGPGTGKTTAVAALVAAIADQASGRVRCALAAPTGKAAARMQEAFTEAIGHMADIPATLRVEPARTLHSLLGAKGMTGQFEHGARNLLPYDVVVVDEMSMVSLPLTVTLLRALGPHTRLVMVGDPNQLSSVEAGAVLADIVAANPPLAYDGAAASLRLVTQLDYSWRFTGDIAALAQAIRDGDSGRALAIVERSDEVALVDIDPRQTTVEHLDELRDQVLAVGTRLVTKARDGDADAALGALASHRVLCAHRLGPYGAAHWAAGIERTLRAHGVVTATEDWYVGRPLLVTANDKTLDVSNGDTGVVIATDDGPRVALDTGAERRRVIQPFLLDRVQTLYAMTIHKSQGSQFDEVTVVLPPPDSPLGNRDLIYTAVTRAKNRVRLVGTPESLAAAIERPSRRASGLAERLIRVQPPRHG